MSKAGRHPVVAGICRLGLPLVIPDTCCLLDIVRAPVRPGFSRHDATLLAKLVGAMDAGTPGVTIVLTEQVKVELDDSLASVTKETEEELRQASDDLVSVLSRMAWLEGVEPREAPRLHDQGHPSVGKDIMERLVASSLTVPDCDDARLAAGDRVTHVTAPSQRAKQSFKDCLVAETALRLAGECRDAGHVAPIVFLSANRSDYCTGKGLELRPPLGEQFTAVNMQFQPRWAALHPLFPSSQPTRAI